jgi:hypothetical protein
LPGGATVGVAKGKVNGRAVQTCTVALPRLNYVAFEKSFFPRTDAEKIGEEREGMRVTRLFILIAGNRKQFVNLTFLASPESRNTVVASSIADG